MLVYFINLIATTYVIENTNSCSRFEFMFIPMCPQHKSKSTDSYYPAINTIGKTITYIESKISPSCAHNTTKEPTPEKELKE